MIERKRWKSLVPSGTFSHLARIPFSSTRPSRIHTHDFPEIFWIESGEARHEINGEEKKLFQGDLVFVRAADRHRLRTAPGNDAGFLLVNLAFPQEMLDALSRRHPEVAALHATSSTPLPMRHRLPAPHLRWLREETPRFAAAPAGRLATERFLLGLYLLAAPPQKTADSPLPEWLERACVAMEQPEHRAQGIPALMRLCGRSPEHVARVCRRLLDKSPTDLVNGIRLAHAARELRLGTRSIVDISLACGFGNLAHFYDLFRRTHGTTPRRYRLECQQMMS